MTRLIDADELLLAFSEDFINGNSPYFRLSEIKTKIDNVLTVASCAEPQVIHCKDCKYQKKWWHEDKRMKEKGYWIYGCELIGDSFVGTPVWGEDNQFCSSAEHGGNENDSRTNT